MHGGRVSQYAEAQARVRARIGAMPTEQQWHYISDATDVDNLIERMRAHGLGHWVQNCPRSPNTAIIEHQLFGALVELVGSVNKLLPRQWHEIKHWLELGVDLALAERLSREPHVEISEYVGANLQRLARLAPEPRLAALQTGPYLRYLQGPIPAFNAWLHDFERLSPRLKGRERYVVKRIHRFIKAHLADIRQLRDRVQSDYQSIDFNAQWHLRKKLAQQLKSLLGGDPFHAGIVLIYGLLEWLQYERCRGLLVANSRKWHLRDLMRGAI